MKSPVQIVLTRLEAFARLQISYILGHIPLITLEFFLLVSVASIIWWYREWILEYPERARNIAIRITQLIGVAAGILLIEAALVAPESSFSFVTSYWNACFLSLLYFPTCSDSYIVFRASSIL